MTGIVLSAAVRQNLLSLQNTATLLATTQNNLSTGKKVNTALDNPTNFFTASGLDNRATDISNLLDGISNGVQVLQAANTGITSLQSLVSQAKSIANQSLQSAIGYSTKSNISTTISGATSSNLLGTPVYTNATATGTAAANAKTSTTTTTATKLSGGTTSVDGLTTALTTNDSLVVDGKTITFNSGSGTTSTAAGASIDITTGTVATLLSSIDAITGATGPTASSVTAGALVVSTGTTSDLTVTGSSNALGALGLGTGLSQTRTATTALGGLNLTIAATGATGVATNITFGTNTGAGQVQTLTQLNTALAANNLQATLDSAGVLTISTTNDYASVTAGGIGGAIGGSAAGVGKLFNGLTFGAPVADATSQTTRANLVSQYNAILTQISNTAQDSSYNGINLLAGDQLQLTFNETGKSKVNITGVDFSAAGLGLSTLTSGTAFIDNASTNTVLATLNSVSATLRGQASAFGSNLSVVQTRQDFNKNLINVLQTGSANLTQADINEEAANSQALSTRQSLSVSALSLANSAQQSVLQLLR